MTALHVRTTDGGALPLAELEDALRDLAAAVARYDAAPLAGPDEDELRDVAHVARRVARLASFVGVDAGG